jgi:hypothetical protein
LVFLNIFLEDTFAQGMARGAAHPSAGVVEQVPLHIKSKDWYVCKYVFLTAFFASGNEDIIFYHHLNLCYSGRAELVSKLQMWWYPPQPRQRHSTPPPSPDPYFLLPFFLWAPQKTWGVKLLCSEECQAEQKGQGATKVCIVKDI